MSDPVVSEEVRRLAEERAERRAAREFAAADALRGRIEELGWRVRDEPEGWVLEPLSPARGETAPRRVRPAEVGSVLDHPPTVDVTVQWIVEGWPQDVARGIASFRRHEATRSVQHVVVDVAGVEDAAWPDEVEVIPLQVGVGWAVARNCGLRRSAGHVVMVVDGSIEADGDVYTPVEEALEDPGVGIAGPFGITTRDLRTFEESAGVGPDRRVDAVEAYLMAFRRGVLAEAGMLDERFTFYRSCDIEYSFRVKEAGRCAVVVDAPVIKHEHRMWRHTPEEMRDRLSKRNYNRFLERFRGRFDLTVAGAPP